MKEKHEHIILYDGICNLCSGIVKFIIKRDKKAKFKFASLQSEIGKSLCKYYNITFDTPDTFIYIRNNQAKLRSTAALYVAKDLGKFWQIFFGFIVIPKFLRDFFYNAISKSRYKIWGMKDTCMLPSKDILNRFIDQ